MGMRIRLMLHSYCLSKMLFDAPGDKGDAETTLFIIIIGAAVAGEFNGRAHLFENFEVVIEATLGNADFVGAVRRFSGGLQMDKIV
jgi:hypothetical protein